MRACLQIDRVEDKTRSLYNGERVNEYSCGTRQVQLSTSNAVFAGIQFVDRDPIFLRLLACASDM
jgi:hypothetical protein